MTMRRSGDATDRKSDGAIHVPGWEAFADSDRALRASPRVADAVMQAWAARTPVAPQRGRGSGVRTWAVAAACLVSVLGGLSVLPKNPPSPEVHRTPVTTARTPEVAAAPIIEVVPNLPAPARGRERLSAAYRAVAGTQEPPLVTLAADPPLEGESLQIVRMRVPRHALQAFGLSIGDPEVAGIVEVDVVVGEDGLPRDIRRVRPVDMNDLGRVSRPSTIAQGVPSLVEGRSEPAVIE